MGIQKTELRKYSCECYDFGHVAFVLVDLICHHIGQQGQLLSILSKLSKIELLIFRYQSCLGTKVT